MSDLLSIGLDVVITVLLGVLIFYAMVLNQRLKTVRESRVELEKLSQQFVDATNAAEASVTNLKVLADQAGKDLEMKVGKAQTLNDDLSFLVQRADDLAEQLADGISGSRSKAKPAKENKSKTDGGDLSSALKDLEKQADQWEEEAKETDDEDTKEALKKSLKGLR